MDQVIQEERVKLIPNIHQSLVLILYHILLILLLVFEYLVALVATSFIIGRRAPHSGYSALSIVICMHCGDWVGV